MPVNRELVARLLPSISPDAPAGLDLRYDARVDAIKEARREDLDLPTNNAEIKRKLADWPQVVHLTSTLLAEDTKDLQLAAWLTEALMRRDGYAGLATGLQVVHGLLDSYWDTVHPLPEDGDDEVRIGPIEWIGAKLSIPLRMVPFGSSPLTYLQLLEARSLPTESDADQSREQRELRAAAIEQGKPTPEVADTAVAALDKAAMRAIVADLDAARDALVSLDAVSDARFGAGAPSLIGLRNTIDEIRRFAAPVLAQRIETDPDPVVADTAEERTSASVAEGAAISLEPLDRIDALNRIGIVSRWLRMQDSGNPAPYLMLRGLRWGETRVAAPELDPRLLEAPSTAVRARLKTLLLDSKWSELLEQSEQVMATAAGRGWLDLQRYALTACLHLGASFDGVAAVIRSELRALLAALPQLSGMTLMDDTPTANHETREWLTREGLESPEVPATDGATGEAQPDMVSAISDGAEPGDATIDTLANAADDDAAGAQQGGYSRTRPMRRAAPRGRDAFELACSELAQNRPTRAIELLMAELARDQSTRGRMVRQTQLAYVMVEAGLDAVAQPILQRLIETIDERNLEQWESGPLVAQPMALMCRVLDRAGGDDSVRHDLYLRVCRLDPLQALMLRPR